MIEVAAPINSGPLSTRWVARRTAERPCLSCSNKYPSPCHPQKNHPPVDSLSADDETMQDARRIDARLTGHEFLIAECMSTMQQRLQNQRQNILK